VALALFPLSGALKEMIMSSKQLYWSYIGIGIAYVVIKIVFVLAGYLHLGAIWHGLIPAVLTTAAGLIAMRTIAPSQRSPWHWILITLPVLVLITTPPFMYWKQRELWLANGRLPVLIIYECLALVQIALATGINKKIA
jgi:hypothetical protein